MEGTVKWFNVKKGYGFIQGEDGEDYFVHKTALPENAKVNEGAKVSFEVTEDERGKRAQNVVIQ